MQFVRNVSLRYKVLFPAAALAVALGVVTLLFTLALRRQSATLQEVREVALERMSAVGEMMLLVERIQSEVFRVAVGGMMRIPEEEQAASRESIEQLLEELRFSFGEISYGWDLDDTERARVARMKRDLDVYAHHAGQAADSVAGNPAVGVMFVRSATGPFRALQGDLAEFLAYERGKVKRIEEGARARSRRSLWLLVFFGFLTAVAAVAATLMITSRYLARPIRSLAGTMRRLADGDLSAGVNVPASRDEIGDMASTLHVFRQNAVERARDKEALEREKERAEQYLDMAGVIILAIDRNGRIALINRKGCEVLGCDEEEIRGRDWFENFIPPEVRDQVRGVFRKLMAGEVEPVEYYENTLLTAAGEERLVAWHNTLLRDPSGAVAGTLSSGTDLTYARRAEAERRRFDEQVRQTQKLESLGVLAGGIAHDFNNLLMGILGNAELAMSRMAPTSPSREYLKNIEQTAERAADLANQMLAYSGKGRFVVEPISLNDLVRDMAHLLKASISKNARLRFDFDEALPAVTADVTQVRQVVMNLITNASEAIGEKAGLITVHTGVQSADAGYLKGCLPAGEDLPEGRYAYLEVSDDGCGMNAETRGKVFEPFFTTKFTGRGLGMSAVLGIVRGHRGGLRVYSEEGHGTSIKVLLPVSGEALSAPANEEADAPDAWHGTGTILLVDDEKVVRNVGRLMLEELGFTVLEAADGLEALEVFRERQTEIAAVVLDMTMPRMGGEEAFRELRRIRPGIKVILSSGYNEQDATNRFAGKGLAGFIQKPYRLSSLREKLRDVF